jgi:hypothetical protein
VYLADSIGATVRTLGYVLWVVAIGLALWAIVKSRLPERVEGTAPRPRATPSAPLPALDADQMWR